LQKKLVLKFKISPLFLFSNFERKFCFVFVLNTEFVKRNSEDTQANKTRLYFVFLTKFMLKLFSFFPFLYPHTLSHFPPLQNYFSIFVKILCSCVRLFRFRYHTKELKIKFQDFKQKTFFFLTSPLNLLLL